MNRWYQDILPGTNLGMSAQINLRTLRLSGLALMKIPSCSCLASRYPLPPRSTGIIGLAGKCKIIHGAQWLTGKILCTKKFQRDLCSIARNCCTTSGRAIMRHIGIERKVRCHRWAVDISCGLRRSMNAFSVTSAPGSSREKPPARSNCKRCAPHAIWPTAPRVAGRSLSFYRARDRAASYSSAE